MTITIEGQVEINGLLLGEGTVYAVEEFNPYTRNVKNQQTSRAFGPGAWSGREDNDAAAIPLRVQIDTANAAAWVSAQQTLAAALTASSTDVELRWQAGGAQYLMFVRPRLVDPDPGSMLYGNGSVKCALEALDSRIYGATLKQAVLALPSVTGGLTVPFTAPFSVNATSTTGRQNITNAGLAGTPLSLRIDAFGSSLVDPRVSLVTGSTVQVLRCNLTLAAGQWLEIDTGARTVYLNGTSSRRGFVSGDFPVLAPGTSELAFDAGTYSSVAQLTATWRDTW